MTVCLFFNSYFLSKHLSIYFVDSLFTQLDAYTNSIDYFIFSLSLLLPIFWLSVYCSTVIFTPNICLSLSYTVLSLNWMLTRCSPTLWHNLSRSLSLPLTLSLSLSLSLSFGSLYFNISSPSLSFSQKSLFIFFLSFFLSYSNLFSSTAHLISVLSLSLFPFLSPRQKKILLRFTWSTITDRRATILLLTQVRLDQANVSIKKFSKLCW